MTAVTFQSLVVIFLSGITVGALIDGVRLLRDNVPYAYARHWYIIELFVWLGCGLGSFYLLYSWQDGHWRWVNFLVQMLGIFVYDRYIFRFVRLVMRVIVYSIITPITFICAFIWKIVLLFLNFIMTLLKLLGFRSRR